MWEVKRPELPLTRSVSAKGSAGDGGRGRCDGVLRTETEFLLQFGEELVSNMLFNSHASYFFVYMCLCVCVRLSVCASMSA